VLSLAFYLSTVHTIGHEKAEKTKQEALPPNDP
jgi:hypothetical protein